MKTPSPAYPHQDAGAFSLPARFANFPSMPSAAIEFGWILSFAASKLLVIRKYQQLPTMAKPPVFEDKQIDHLVKATMAYSRVPERDKALLLVLYGTAMATTELATIEVRDYLMDDGSVKVTSEVRPEVAHNGEARPLYWSNPRVTAALDAYLDWRKLHRHGVTSKKGAYRGLDPVSPLFLTDAGQPYTLTQKRLPSGVLSYSCVTLGAAISRMHANAGLEGGSANAARRTLAVKLHRKGYDLVHIAALLGQKSVSTTKRMVAGDPVRLADIVAKAI